MNRKDVIKVLKMENDLITFDPHTGEEIDVRCLNDLNKKCYIAHEEAIDFLRQSIPIKWIKNYASHKASKDLIDCYWHFWEDDVLQMIADWEKENANNKTE